MAGSMVQLVVNKVGQRLGGIVLYCTYFCLCLHSTGIIQTHNLLIICSQFAHNFFITSDTVLYVMYENELFDYRLRYCPRISWEKLRHRSSFAALMISSGSSKPGSKTWVEDTYWGTSHWFWPTSMVRVIMLPRRHDGRTLMLCGRSKRRQVIVKIFHVSNQSFCERGVVALRGSVGRKGSRSDRRLDCLELEGRIRLDVQAFTASTEYPEMALCSIFSLQENPSRKEPFPPIRGGVSTTQI